MTNITFAVMTDLRRQKELLSMMHSLYDEDEAASPVDRSRFAANIEFLIAHPENGQFILFNQDAAPLGYALLVPYWSNEFSGTLLFIDEMFVAAAARRQGVGRAFFRYLEAARPFEAVALALEVSPRNAGARRLYESLGFRQRKNSMLTRPL